jgi:hypothetical protein
MRRKIGRVTDVEWMVRSEDYAREIIRIALAEPEQPELHSLAQRLQAALLTAPVLRPPPPAAEPPAREPAGRYVGRLR